MRLVLGICIVLLSPIPSGAEWVLRYQADGVSTLVADELHHRLAAGGSRPAASRGGSEDPADR